MKSTRSMAASSNLTAAEQRLEQRLGLGMAVSPVHEVTLSVLTDLINLGTSMAHTAGDEAPLQLRVMMRTLDSARPILLRSIAGMPPAKIKELMGELVARMQSIIDTPDVPTVHTLGGSDDDTGASRAGAAIATGT